MKIYLETVTEIFSFFPNFSFIIKDRETFFTPAQRSQVVWKILTRTRFDEGVRDKPAVHQVSDKTTKLIWICRFGMSFVIYFLLNLKQTGIRRLLNDKTFHAAFPLHDGPYDEDDFNGEPNDRRVSSNKEFIKE